VRRSGSNLGLPRDVNPDGGRVDEGYDAIGFDAAGGYARTDDEIDETGRY
jgi:hypothetical protein